MFLEPALRALEGDAGAVVRQLGLRELDEPEPRPLPAEIEIERAGHRLERRGQEGRTAPAAARGLTLAEQDQGPEIDPSGKTGETGRAHDRCPSRRKKALVVARMRLVEGL